MWLMIAAALAASFALSTSAQDTRRETLSSAVVPLRYELTVDDHTPAQPEGSDLRVRGRDVPIVAAIQPQPATSGVADSAYPVELDLERPPRTNRNRTRRRQHRLDQPAIPRR